MIKEHIELLLKQKLISKRKFERETTFKIDKSVSDDSFSEKAKQEIISNYFNVSETYLNEKINYNFLLRFGNVFIICIFIAILIPLTIIFLNKSIDTIYLLIGPIIACSLLVPTIIFYRNYKLIILLMIPLFFAFYLLGLFGVYYFVLRNPSQRISNLIFGNPLFFTI